MPKTKTATPAAVEAKTRAPAKELMAGRKRVTFGAAFINGVIGGYHRDGAKMVLLGKELGLGTQSELSKLDIAVLREKLGETILALPDGAMPTSTTFS